MDLENSSSELKTDLKDFYLDSVKEVEVTLSKGKTKNIYLVFVPFVCLKLLQKVHKKIVLDVEKKLKATVLFIAKRNIQSKWVKTHKSQMRPRSRTLTSVHEGILEDLVLPGVIIAKRVRCRVDGSKFYKITLDAADKDILEERAELISSVYKKLTTKDVHLDFKHEQVFYSIKK